MLRDEYRIREVTKATAGRSSGLWWRSTRRAWSGRSGFNAAAQEGPFNPAIKDGKAPGSPPKSNWPCH
jgi:hypothetical protein